jgi:hypothetical protein
VLERLVITEERGESGEFTALREAREEIAMKWVRSA